MDSVQLEQDKLYYNKSDKILRFYINSKHNPDLFVGEFMLHTKHFYPTRNLLTFEEMKKIIQVIEEHL